MKAAMRESKEEKRDELLDPMTTLSKPYWLTRTWWRSCKKFNRNRHDDQQVVLVGLDLMWVM